MTRQRYLYHRPSPVFQYTTKARPRRLMPTPTRRRNYETPPLGQLFVAKRSRISAYLNEKIDWIRSVLLGSIRGLAGLAWTSMSLRPRQNHHYAICNRLNGSRFT